MKNSKLNTSLLYAVALAFAVTSCANPEALPEETTTADSDSTQVEIVEADEEPNPAFEIANMTDSDRMVIYEDGVTHQPAQKEGENKTAEERNKDSHFMQLYDARFLPQAGDIEGFMESRAFDLMQNQDSLVSVYPLEETQSLTAYSKKGKFEGEIQVVSSSASGEISHIVFTGKQHVDKYNVSTGLTGHEARKLRRELKHMAHDGEVFLYEEESNIIYLMDSKNLVTGEEITEADIDNMTISAILWKDSKHMTEHGHEHAHAEGDGHDHGGSEE